VLAYFLVTCNMKITRRQLRQIIKEVVDEDLPHDEEPSDVTDEESREYTGYQARPDEPSPRNTMMPARDQEPDPSTGVWSPDAPEGYPTWVQDDMKILSAEDVPAWWGKREQLETGEGEWKNKVIPSTPDENPNLSTGDSRWSMYDQAGLRSYPVMTYPGVTAPGWIQIQLDRLIWVPTVGVNVDSDGRLNVLGSDYYARQLHYGADQWAGRGINTAAAIAEWRHEQSVKKANRWKRIIELAGGVEQVVARAEKERREFSGASRDDRGDNHFRSALGQTKEIAMDAMMED